MTRPACHRCGSTRAERWIDAGPRGDLAECANPYACERRRILARLRPVVRKWEALAREGGADALRGQGVAHECWRAAGGRFRS